ncbi:hypothetical protein BDW02DRAFT_603541 [Decorospora gaudefroyi]|uniref:Uncharacterized protein n=1 Tax=Decorospora gaudefroyi TaxID=184978 RepID=A0A6A5JWQ9_9PLEO|nr:hypothetical protein BDW02DRAFT_603541 [Decorospora gaudefroyi]
MSLLPKNNAFGPFSPSWNLPFPTGNLTAAEIVAYLPHWLKSIDVADRFISHGGRAITIAAMINEFRDQPSGAPFKANSVMIMIQYSMRRAGYNDWSIGTHSDHRELIARPEDDLDVKHFRTPRTTHPKDVRTLTPQKASQNQEAEPIEFKDLAIHVKEHPSGADALDLARCVQYAVEHEDEEWIFPTDFEQLTIHLGGPAPVTHAHYDRQVFARRENYISSPAKSTPGKARTPTKKPTPQSKVKTSRSNMRARVAEVIAGALSGSSTPQQRVAESLGRVELGSKRRSSRLVGKKLNFGEDSEFDNADGDFGDSPFSTPVKKRKLNQAAATANDSDFQVDESEPDDDVPAAEDASDTEEIESPSTAVRGRLAARKARFHIKASFVPERTPPKPKAPKVGVSTQKGKQPQKDIPAYMTSTYDPEVMDAARAFSSRKPLFIQPPVLSANRLKIDNLSVYLYSLPPHTSLAEMYASAFSSTRFNGPRRHAPFRELHMLSDPDPMDISDWAENIRWAKEQWSVFGTVWTEYDYFLDCISEHRRAFGWVSEEAVRAGMGAHR